MVLPFVTTKNKQFERRLLTSDGVSITQRQSVAPNGRAERIKKANILGSIGGGLMTLILIITVIIIFSATGVIDFISGYSRKVIERKGVVIVSTEYAKADVYLGSQKLGTTPLEEVSVAAGKYTLVLRPIDDQKQFFVPMEIPIEVSPGNATVVKGVFAPTERGQSNVVITSETKISEDESAISIISDPTGAEVFVDGQSRGKTPLTLGNEYLSAKKIKLMAVGYKEMEVEINPEVGKVILIRGKLYKYMIPEKE